MKLIASVNVHTKDAILNSPYAGTITFLMDKLSELNLNTDGCTIKFTAELFKLGED